MMFNNANGYYVNDWNTVPSYMRNMMQSYYTGAGGIFFQLDGVLRFITWILVIILLIALIRWVWQKSNK